jgi:type VI secretion system protein ImpC
VLHEPRLQALEAAWRGVDRMVRELELGETLQLAVLDVARDEITADLGAHGGDLAASALHRLLNAATAPDDARFDLLVLDFAFGPDAADIQQLAALGALAARGGATLLASATPQLAGCQGLAALAEPRIWTTPESPGFAHWNALRTSPMAAWIGLVLPRVLQRLPYGAASDPITAFAFEEMPAPREHEAYLWGQGALALALLVGRAFQQDGWAMSLEGSLDLDDLPSHVVVEDGERQQQPCAELLIPEAAGLALQQRGLMPLMSWRGRNAVRLLGWQSIAEPPSALKGLQA